MCARACVCTYTIWGFLQVGAYFDLISGRRHFAEVGCAPVICCINLQSQLAARLFLLVFKALCNVSGFIIWHSAAFSLKVRTDFWKAAKRAQGSPSVRPCTSNTSKILSKPSGQHRPKNKIDNLRLFQYHVPYTFYYFVLWPTNAQLFHKLLYCFYVFRHYCVFLRELVVCTSAKVQKYVNAAVRNTI